VNGGGGGVRGDYRRVNVVPRGDRGDRIGGRDEGLGGYGDDSALDPLELSDFDARQAEGCKDAGGEGLGRV
jgi:hypothetical protein